MSKRPDHYVTLGVERNATADDIRGAYRKLARQFHPDVNGAPDASARFKEISTAYEVLSDPEKRRRYDMFGDGDAGDLGFGIDDLFGAFFGGTRRRERGAVRGADLRVELELDLEQAVEGVQRTIGVPRQESCARCKGSGAEPDSKTSTCATCNGRGEVRQVQQSLFGRFVSVGQCPRCGGSGRTIDRPCTECSGEGRVMADRKVDVSIPAGIDEGQQLRVPGEGESGMRGGPPGDLYVLIRLRKHDLFQRDGDDLIHVLRITPSQAVLGDEIDVPTIDGGNAKVKVPSGAQSGQSVRIHGKGVPRLHANGRGDELVYLDVAVPRTLSKEERTLYKKLREIERPAKQGEDGDEGLLGKVRDAFGG